MHTPHTLSCFPPLGLREHATPPDLPTISLVVLKRSIIYLCVCVSMYACHMLRFPVEARRVSDSLELELETAVSHSLWVLGTWEESQMLLTTEPSPATTPPTPPPNPPHTHTTFYMVILTIIGDVCKHRADDYRISVIAADPSSS